ncbi:SH2 domain-containing protein 7-like [Betta splendens]|uniref:SH2 domain-containing protein 7-like n=1 Tax=Betta splendens TaxID=158456 RepID=A0A6P7MT82_BETSP|nr:SH2 domain-containing protein 7-like [Betta splendens]
MTPGSNHALLFSRQDTDASCCRPQRRAPEGIGALSGQGQNQKRAKKPSGLGTCLKFCFKGRAKMERRQREPGAGSPAEGAEGRLRELAAKWFVETQLPSIVHNGFFPSWFLGFISRRDAEEILKDKELGCFLIRLSDKAVGYILSYRGRDRCRHFVINQGETGRFAVSGDSNRYDSVSELIEYYKTRPIEPFGEYLTSPCFAARNEDLYDVIQVSPKASAGRGVKSAPRPQPSAAPEPTATRPVKSHRTPEEVPPLPRRSRHLDGASIGDQDGVLYAQLRKQAPRERPRSQNLCQDAGPGGNPRKAPRSAAAPPGPVDASYSELSLLEGGKSRSLPLLDAGGAERCCRLSAPPRLSPRPGRPAPPAEAGPDPRSHSLDYVGDGAVYHLAGGQPGRSPCADNTYELIPEHEDAGRPQPGGNTYEPLEDLRPRPSKNENGKWKWLFPDAKRKW